MLYVIAICIRTMYRCIRRIFGESILEGKTKIDIQKC